jgi:protein translocase SecG subunit
MRNALLVVQLVSAILMILTILLQQKGTGLGEAFGGGGNVYQTRRGAEKVLMYATIVLAIIFFASSFATAVVL